MRRTLAVLLAIPLCAPAVWAATSSDDYGPTDKLSRGIANMTTGVLEVPGTIVDKTHDDGAVGVPIGFGVGLARTVARELVGVYDLVTFPLPQPNDYAPVMSPAYPWQYFTESRDLREASSHRHQRTLASSRTNEPSHEARAASQPSHETRTQTTTSGEHFGRAHVRDVQHKLADMGYNPGPVDGIVGPKTRSALRSFQKDKNLQVTGRIDADTRSAMNLGSQGNESPTAGTRGNPPTGTMPRSTGSGSTSPQQ